MCVYCVQFELQVYRVLLRVCESVFRLHTKLPGIRENQLGRQLEKERGREIKGGGEEGERGMTKR